MQAGFMRRTLRRAERSLIPKHADAEQTVPRYPETAYARFFPCKRVKNSYNCESRPVRRCSLSPDSSKKPFVGRAVYGKRPDNQ